MCLGALVDAGCPVDELRQTLAGLGIPGFDLRAHAVMRGVLHGTKVDVLVEEEPHVHRTLGDVLAIVDRIQWPGRVRQQIEQAFTALARAEGAIHGKSYDQIHFHEVGSFDAIIDISGSLLAVHLMGIEQCSCSRVHVGTGLIAGTRHGQIPAPAPATIHLLKGFEVYSTNLPYEMVTPTGAALIQTLCDGSSPMPPMRLDGTGYGAGGREVKELPNMLRVLKGEMTPSTAERVVVIETNLDDMNPEWFEPLMNALLSAGALDVTLTPTQMKKGRPGVLLGVVAPLGRQEELSRLILRHSTSIGVRMYECERRILQREPLEVSTPWGSVRGKIAWSDGVEPRFSPEYDDCKRLAAKQGIPVAHVYEAALIAYRAQAESF